MEIVVACAKLAALFSGTGIGCLHLGIFYAFPKTISFMLSNISYAIARIRIQLFQEWWVREYNHCLHLRVTGHSLVRARASAWGSTTALTLRLLTTAW